MITASRGRGFTIVELLVVIVVIAILAAVSVIAYNGVQARAENAKTLAGIDQLAKAMQAYKADNGRYPLVRPVGVSGVYTYACVVSDTTKSCGKVGGTDNTCMGLGSSTGTTVFDTAIKTVLPKVPDVSSQDLQCDNITVRGAFYYVHFLDPNANNQNAYLVYFLKGNEQCRAPVGSTVVKQAVSGDTRCQATFNA